MENISLRPNFLEPDVSDDLFDYLEKNIDWTDELTASDGSLVKIHRKMAYLSDSPVRYNYANLSFMGSTWNPLLKILKLLLEKEIGVSFNSVLLNRYADGKDEIRWHSDKEPSLGENPVIACVNLGAARNFWFRPVGPDQEKFSLIVSHGDLLVMGPECQQKYAHAILKEKEIISPRISLTFRLNL